MQRGGDDESGFAVSFDAPTRTVRVEAWGFWSASVGMAFGKTVIDVCHASPQPRRVEMEMTRLKPLREEGENAWAMMLGVLPEEGIEAIAVKTNSLTKLQLLRVARQSASRAIVRFL